MRKRLLKIISLGLVFVMASSSLVFGADSYASIGGIDNRTHKYSEKDYIIIDGVDISNHNGDITQEQWNKLKRAGIDFVFLRSSVSFYGTSHKVYPTQINKTQDKSRMTKDARFETNYTRAKNAHMMIGTYHYTSAVTKEEAQHEAEFTLNSIGNKHLDLPVAFDTECVTDRCKNLTETKRVNLATHFYNYIKNNSNYQTAYYSYLALMKKEGFQNNASKIESAGPIWLAQYNNSVTYNRSFNFWQHTDLGTFKSIFGSGKVFDCNFWYFDRNNKIIKPSASSTTACVVKSKKSAVLYDGKIKEPGVVVTYGGKTLTEGSDYTVSYVKNVKKGTGYAIVTGKGAFDGQAAASFKIADSITEPEPINGAEVTDLFNTYKYNASGVKPTPTVTYKGKTLTKDVDYRLSYSDNTEVGTATVKIKGIGNYTGSISRTFKIRSVDMSEVTVKVSDMYCTGKNAKPEITVSRLSENDYDIECDDTTKVGTANVTITGKNNATGSITKSFQVKLDRPENLNLSLYGHDDVKVTWDKAPGATGYEVSYRKSTASEYTKYSTKFTELSSKKGNLENGVKYYFKVVPFVKTDDGRAYGRSASKSIYTLDTPKEVTTKLYRYDGVKVSWTKVNAADKYKVYFKRASSTGNFILAGTTSNNYFKKGSLKTGTKYIFRVVPLAKSGNTYYKVTDKSQKQSSITTLKKVNKPVAKRVSAKYIKVSWANILGETGYQISKTKKEGRTNIVARVASSSASSKKLEVKSRTPYYYKVRAYKKYGNTYVYGPWSNERRF